MTNLYSTIDSILRTAQVPFYTFMPDFASEEKPRLFVTYSTGISGTHRADGEIIDYECTVTLDIFGVSQGGANDLFFYILSAFERAGIRLVDCYDMVEDDEPKYFRKTAEFRVIQEREDN